MTRQSLALAVRDAAAATAIECRPRQLFLLANRLDRLAVVLAAQARADARQILDDETRPGCDRP